MEQKMANQFIFGKICLLLNGLGLIIGCTCKKYTSLPPETTILNRNMYDAICSRTISIIVLGVFCDVREYVEIQFFPYLQCTFSKCERVIFQLQHWGEAISAKKLCHCNSNSLFATRMIWGWKWRQSSITVRKNLEKFPSSHGWESWNATMSTALCQTKNRFHSQKDKCQPNKIFKSGLGEPSEYWIFKEFLVVFFVCSLCFTQRVPTLRSTAMPIKTRSQITKKAGLTWWLDLDSDTAYPYVTSRASGPLLGTNCQPRTKETARWLARQSTKCRAFCKGGGP